MYKWMVTCKEKKGHWLVLANTEYEAIYEATKHNPKYTDVEAFLISQ